MNAFKTLITHAKNFHADDVFSTALLAILTKRETHELDIIRSNYPYKELSEDVLNDPENIMYDIGRGKFDHHQADSPVRENGIKYAAFGLLWKEFGDWEKYPDFDKDFVSKIDDHDNGGKMNDISLIIRSFNPTSMELDGLSEKDQIEVYDRQFYKAVAFAKDYLDNLFKSYDELDYSKKYIKKNAEFVTWEKDKSKRIMILPEYVGRLDDIILDYYKDVIAVMYPSNRGGYAVKVIPKGKDTMESYYTFPYAWCGAEPNKLPSEVQFCHKSGFLATYKNIDAAMTARYDLSTHATEKNSLFRDGEDFKEFIYLNMNKIRKDVDQFDTMNGVLNLIPKITTKNNIITTVKFSKVMSDVILITPTDNRYESFFAVIGPNDDIDYWVYEKTGAII